MLLSAARLARLLSRRPSKFVRRSRLSIEGLEDRAVPANTLNVVGDILQETNINVSPLTAGTITISTTGGNAAVSLETLQNALTNPQATRVVVTTAVAAGGTNANQIGEINWDASLEGSLDFTGFGAGKTLTFRTVDGTNATGSITLTAVAFLNAGTDDRISLEFDSSAVNGDVTFRDDGFTTVVYSAESVNNLTVTAGTGAFSFLDTGFNIGGADAAGAVSISAGPILITHQGDMSAGTAMTIAGDDIFISDGAGLFANLNVTVTGATSVELGNSSGVTADGNASIAAPQVNAQSAFLAPTGDLTVTSSGIVNLFGTQVTPGGNLLISGATVESSFGTLSAGGNVVVTGTTEVTLDLATVSGGGGVSLTGGATTLTGTTISGLGDVTVTGTTTDLNFSTVFADGDILVSGTSVNLDSSALVTAADLTVAGAVTIGNSVSLEAPEGAILVTGTMDGAADVFVLAGTTATFQQDVGATSPLNSIEFGSGLVGLGSNDLAAATVSVGSLSTTSEATLSGGVTITGNVFVNSTGNLAPGGLGVAGITTVLGNVNFDGGDFAVDFGGSDRPAAYLRRPAHTRPGREPHDQRPEPTRRRAWHRAAHRPERGHH